jgi:sugar lactone lactonase YvrE
MAATGEIVVTGLGLLEGPVWCPADDLVPTPTVVCTSVTEGVLHRVWPEEGRVELIAVVGGGANAAQRASDGGFVVTQNGGIDYSTTDLFEDPPPYRPITPGIQHVSASGDVRYVCSDGFLAPNDLIVTADGTLLFTDPPSWPPTPGPPVGRVHALTPDGEVSVVASDLAYPNGIALDPDGAMLVVERDGLFRRHADGSVEWVVPEGTTEGDGIAVDVDGRIYLCAGDEGAVRVFGADGREEERLAVPDSGLITNCCFGGDDGCTLFGTCGIPGQVVAWERMPTPGLPVRPWPMP